MINLCLHMELNLYRTTSCRRDGVQVYKCWGRRPERTWPCLWTFGVRNAGSRVDYAAMKETSVGDSLSDSCMIFSVSLTVVGTAFDVARDIIGSSMLNRPVHFNLF